MTPHWLTLTSLITGLSLFCWGFTDSRRVYWKIRATKYVSGLVLMLMAGAVALILPASV